MSLQIETRDASDELADLLAPFVEQYVTLSTDAREDLKLLLVYVDKKEAQNKEYVEKLKCHGVTVAPDVPGKWRIHLGWLFKRDWKSEDY